MHGLTCACLPSLLRPPQAKEMLEDMGFAKGGTTVVVGGATIAGFFAAACSLPFDYVKTQMQKMKPDPVTGELPFKVRRRSDKQGGPRSCWHAGGCCACCNRTSRPPPAPRSVLDGISPLLACLAVRAVEGEGVGAWHTFGAVGARQAPTT